MEFERKVQLDRFQQRLGYSFSDVGLLDTALTHTSYVKGDGRAREHNERLEFLGDAVLELCVSEYLYRSYSYMDEGVMTRTRSLAVYEPALFAIASDIDIGEALLLSRGEEHSGGREKPSILADAVEAVIGAIYLDGGLEAAKKLILSLAGDGLMKAAKHVNSKDYKTLLQEYVQKQHKGNASYVLLSAEGPDHKKRFRMSVQVAGSALGEGEGSSKQEAGQNAAKTALQALGQLD